LTAHSLAVRIYYEDTDFSGLVYHAAYLKFFERGRTEMLRALGINHHELQDEGVAFAVRRMQIDYLAAARIDDLLTVETVIAATTGARLGLTQRILREDHVLVAAGVEIVAIRIGGGATRLPKTVRERLATQS
jgi:acyl-CoA thioester hydrolase